MRKPSSLWLLLDSPVPQMLLAAAPGYGSGYCILVSVAWPAGSHLCQAGSGLPVALAPFVVVPWELPLSLLTWQPPLGLRYTSCFFVCWMERGWGTRAPSCCNLTALYCHLHIRSALWSPSQASTSVFPVARKCVITCVSHCSLKTLFITQALHTPTKLNQCIQMLTIVNN